MRFLIVGAAGFVADAAILTVCISVAGLGPISGRAVSAPAAVVFTFVLNRNWSFAAAAPRSWRREFGAYVGVQATGFATNIAIYTGALATLPAPLSAPLIALALASTSAIAVNFLGARLLVFRPTERI